LCQRLPLRSAADRKEFCELGYECCGVFFEWYPPDYDDSDNSITDL